MLITLRVTKSLKIFSSRPFIPSNSVSYTHLSYRLKLADGTVTNHTGPSLYDALVAGRGKIFFDLDFLNKVSPKELYDVLKSCGMLDRVFFYTSNNRDVLRNILDYSPAPIPVSYTHLSRKWG